jgi:dTDP-glucose 4,6-dehydratase
MKSDKKILITGGCGFIGHHFVEHVLRNTNWDVVIIDKLNYASKGLNRLRDLGNVLGNPRVNFFCGDMSEALSSGVRDEIGDDINYIVHMGAETHVDNSIRDPEIFVKSNVMGTFRLLEYTRTLSNLETFFYFSTDEVFGAAPPGVAYKEWDRHKPTNPYSATKAAAEDLCIAYENTYKIPIIIVNVMNAFGERQHVEKFIPNTIRKLLRNETVLIHANKDKTVPGSRFYIHARNIAAAVLFILENGELGEKYNIVGEKEVNNLELAQLIAKVMEVPLKYELVDFHSNRPGHDLRYCLQDTKLTRLGWELPVSFDESLANTIQWTLNNRYWLED